MRIPYSTMYSEFLRVLKKYNLEDERAELSATLFAQASLDGVYTHGLNRFPKFIASVENHAVKINERPVCVSALGVLERWNGNEGPGNLNAYECMERAVALAKSNTLGCVALSNTNHWMRPGAYGLMAAKQNCIAIMWTNTVPNMPPWGGLEAKLGNNPVVIAIPNGDTPILLDVAMSMFSYGKLESYSRQNKELPVDGGFDCNNNISRNASEILKSHRTLPIGYWKGSGLSLTLDIIAAVLAGGNSSYEIGKLPIETNLSQIFLAIDIDSLPDSEKAMQTIKDTIDDLHSCISDNESPVRFPGEGMIKVREENTRLGIPVEESVWEAVTNL